MTKRATKSEVTPAGQRSLTRREKIAIYEGLREPLLAEQRSVFERLNASQAALRDDPSAQVAADLVNLSKRAAEIALELAPYDELIKEQQEAEALAERQLVEERARAKAQRIPEVCAAIIATFERVDRAFDLAFGIIERELPLLTMELRTLTSEALAIRHGGNVSGIVNEGSVLMPLAEATSGEMAVAYAGIMRRIAAVAANPRLEEFAMLDPRAPRVPRDRPLARAAEADARTMAAYFRLEREPVIELRQLKTEIVDPQQGRR